MEEIFSGDVNAIISIRWIKHSYSHIMMACIDEKVNLQFEDVEDNNEGMTALLAAMQANSLLQTKYDMCV
jgi:hypothetical protein